MPREIEETIKTKVKLKKSNEKHGERTAEVAVFNKVPVCTPRLAVYGPKGKPEKLQRHV